MRSAAAIRPCGFLLWMLNDFHHRRVVIGDGKLSAGGDGTTLLDAVTKVGRRRVLGLFPAV